MKIIFEEHISIRKQPMNIIGKDLSLFEHEFEKKIRNTHLIKIQNGIILNDIIVTIIHGYRKFLRYTCVHPTITIKSLIKRILLFRKGMKTIKKGVWIIDDWSLGYFHFLTDTLPRLLASRREQENYPILFPDTYKYCSYIYESLRLLKGQVYYYDTKKPLKVKDIVIASHTAETGNYNNILINELREKFLNNFKQIGDRKVYISRQKALKRKITNEGEVINLVTSCGYEVHYFEDYPFEKQVEIISQTKKIIGLHGAGLTNILFLREGGMVLELRNLNDANNNCYFSLASELNLRYFYQLCQGDTSDTHRVNVTVDIDEFRKKYRKNGTVKLLELLLYNYG